MGSWTEPDEWLMAEVAKGRQDLMEPLVRRHASPLLTFIHRMTGDHHRSEELFQDVFLAVWVNRRQYRYPRPFKPWLYAIAVNKCRAMFRVRGLGAISALPDDPVPAGGDPDLTPADAAIATETATMVESAVAQLPPRQKMVVVMKVWTGLSYTQIAEALSLAEGTVRSTMHDALASIRRFLEPRMRT